MPGFMKVRIDALVPDPFIDSSMMSIWLRILDSMHLNQVDQ